MDKNSVILFAILLGITSVAGYYLGYHAGFSARDPQALDTLSPTVNDILTHYQDYLEYSA